MSPFIIAFEGLADPLLDLFSGRIAFCYLSLNAVRAVLGSKNGNLLARLGCEVAGVDGSVGTGTGTGAGALMSDGVYGRCLRILRRNRR